MKILVISHPCITAILQSFYADLEEETGASVTLVVPSRWGSQYRAGTSENHARWPSFRGRILRVNVFMPGDIPRHLYRTSFLKLMREEKPDVIYMNHEPYGFATAQVYLANLLTVRRPIGFYAAQNILKRYPLPIRLLERWVFRHSSFAFPVTQTALDILRTKGYQNAAEVLPLSLNPSLYHSYPEWASERRGQLGILPDSFVIGYVGRLVAEKGLGVLFSALEQLDGFPWTLVIVGAGPFEADLRSRAESSDRLRGRVHFMGYVPHDETPRWLGMFDVLALPSETRPNWKEQFGRVLVEAIACGTPVVGSDSGEIPHIINATGGGIVFPEGDVAKLAEALASLGQSPALRAELTRKGQEAVARLYDQRHLARIFATVLEAAVTRAQS